VAVGREGTITLVNERTAQMFGYESNELIGNKLEILLPERYRAAHSGHLARYFGELRERPMGTGMELSGRRKDGTEFPVEIGLRWIETPLGVLAVAMVVDITERKRIESELARVHAELVRSNAELAQFAYVASHDLQEPLRMITGYLQLLQRRYQDHLDDEAQEFIRYAVDGATRMKGLIQDLLRLSRAGTKALQVREVEAASICRSACANLHVAIEESGAEVIIEDLPAITADSGLLTQVFQNIIGNALKFHAKDVRPRIAVSAQAQGDGWTFSIQDNGIGIEPKYTQRIFRIFERLHGADEYGGSGVGLAISQRIIERHGGRIWLESERGKGSTFFFSIPIHSAKPQASAKRA
jgi:PAS domain S-box-containing protein